MSMRRKTILASVLVASAAIVGAAWWVCAAVLEGHRRMQTVCAFDNLYRATDAVIARDRQSTHDLKEAVHAWYEKNRGSRDPLDGWGRPVEFGFEKSGTGTYVLNCMSLGRDGVAGSNDDMHAQIPFELLSVQPSSSQAASDE